jgi:hypothetical protein
MPPRGAARGGREDFPGRVWQPRRARAQFMRTRGWGPDSRFIRVRSRTQGVRRRCARSAASRTGRGVVARRPAHRRSALAARGGPGSPPRLAARSSRQGRATSRVRDGRWGWHELELWLDARIALPIGPLFCIINGRTRGRPWTTSGTRAELRRAAARAGVRRRFAPHQRRHAHAVEMAREGVPLIVIQRRIGHSNLGITSVYLQGIDNAESSKRSTPAAPP